MTPPLPLALLPGLLCDAALWQAQSDELSGIADCRVADLTKRADVADLARDVLAMMPARFAMAGQSMGGYVALEVMRQAPERVTRLALVNTSARPDMPAQTSRRRGLVQLASKGRFKGVTPRLLPLLIHPDRLEDSLLVAAVTAMAERLGRDAFVNQQKAIMSRPDSRPGLRRIACPTLVISGRQDALTPLDCHEEMAGGIAGARLVVIEDCGHLAPMERPAEVTQALRAWLTAD